MMDRPTYLARPAVTNPEGKLDGAYIISRPRGPQRWDVVASFPVDGRDACEHWALTHPDVLVKWRDGSPVLAQQPHAWRSVTRGGYGQVRCAYCDERAGTDTPCVRS